MTSEQLTAFIAPMIVSNLLWAAMCLALILAAKWR